MKILVTGGAGYIGSHTCVELLNEGYEVVVVDNLYNASEKALERVKEITGKPLTFYKADLLDQKTLDQIFDKEKPEAVIHFAGYKAVGESAFVRYHAQPWCKEYHIQFFRYRIRRSGHDSDHGRVPEKDAYQSLRTDKDHVRAGTYGYPKSRSSVECDSAPLF